jgi:enoyl-CoA hydratase/carnithine racemase
MGAVMIQELQNSLNSLEQEADSRCVVLTSFSHKVFSAGADLKERKSMTQQGEAEQFV